MDGYRDIKPQGFLTIDNQAVINNVGATLYRTHTFDGTWTTYDGQKVAYQQPSISEVIGSVAGVIEGAQGVSITARSFTNVDVTAGTVGNIRDAVHVIGSGASGAASAGAHAVAGTSSGGAAVTATASASSNQAGVAAAADALGGGLSGIGRIVSSGIGNQLRGGETVSGSGDGTSGNVLAGASAARKVTSVQGAALGNVVKVSPSGLFIRNPDANGDYVYETRPQFANQQQWTSSDYLLSQLALDPAVTQKRLGDGFYEQQMVREQLSELTGHASTAGLSDDAAYKQLLTNAVSAAQAFGLRPGVALSAEQVSQLTSDIVWMVSETVMLSDGSTQTVLVPQVYLAHVGDDAVKPSGALVTGNGVSIDVTDSIVNRGGVIDGGNGRTLLLAGQDIVNQGGTIEGNAVALAAGNDIKNESLAVKETYDFGQNSGSNTSLSNVASITATGSLDVMAGRDLSDVAGKISAGSATLSAGRNVDFNTIQTGSTYQSLISGYTEKDSSVFNQLSQISTGGDLKIAAMGNLNLTGTQVAIGTAGSGTGQLLAGGTINIASVTNEVKTSVQNDPSSKDYDKQVHDNQTVVGAGVAAAGDLTVAAGLISKGDLNVTGSAIAGAGNVTLSATNDVNIANAMEGHLSDTATHRESSSTFKKSSSTSTDYSASTQVVGSSVNGASVTVKATNDIAIAGSTLSATDALALNAGRDLSVTSVASTDSENHTHEEKKSGFSLGAGGIGYSKNEQNQLSNGTTVTQAGSMLSGGTVSTTSGRDTLIQGSTVVADTDIRINAGRDLSIVSAENSSKEATASSSKQSGTMGSFFQPAIGTVKSTQDGTQDQVTQVGSQVASLGGSITLTAGNKYTQTASDVLAQSGDIAIVAKDVLINSAADTSNGTDHATYSRTAIGAAVSVPVINALKSVSSMVEAAKDTGDTRMKALAAMDAAATIKDAPKSVGQTFSYGKKILAFARFLKEQSKNSSVFELGAFTAVCCERQYPVYVKAASGSSWGNANILRDNLDAVWRHLEGGSSIALSS